MYRIFIVSRRPERFSVLAGAIQRGGKIEIELTAPGDQALFGILSTSPDLVILDEKADGAPDFEFIRRVINRNAFINFAVVSRLPEKEFHETSEGLGVLMQLPTNPGLPEAGALLEIINREVK
jgi:DNA-binding NarL/FixJ family response regulator